MPTAKTDVIVQPLSLPFAVFPEYRIETLNDFLVSIGFAPDYRLVRDARDMREVIIVPLCEAVEPARISIRERIRVFLVGFGQLVARQRLHIDKAFGVDKCVKANRSIAVPASTDARAAMGIRDRKVMMSRSSSIAIDAKADSSRAPKTSGFQLGILGQDEL